MPGLHEPARYPDLVLTALRRFPVVDALPLTPVGKLDKKVLRSHYWAGRTRQVN